MSPARDVGRDDDAERVAVIGRVPNAVGESGGLPVGESVGDNEERIPAAVIGRSSSSCVGSANAAANAARRSRTTTVVLPDVVGRLMRLLDEEEEEDDEITGRVEEGNADDVVERTERVDNGAADVEEEEDSSVDERFDIKARNVVASNYVIFKQMSPIKMRDDQ
jgi:hypothetical protein